MSKDDKKEDEYKVSGYKYELVRDMAFDNKATIDNLVDTLTHLTTSESEMLSLIRMLEDEVREREAKIADLTSENFDLKASIAEDIKKRNDSLDFKDKWINALKEENKSLLLLRNQLSTQLFSANVEIEHLKQRIDDLEYGENKEDKE